MDNRDVNKENEELYNNLIKDSKPLDNGDWDINNPIVKIVLLVLGIIIVIGLIVYFILKDTFKDINFPEVPINVRKNNK